MSFETFDASEELSGYTAIQPYSCDGPGLDSAIVDFGFDFLAHQTEIATLFAWVIKLHLTQVFSPRLEKYAKP